jgi:hypothetical protein
MKGSDQAASVVKKMDSSRISEPQSTRRVDSARTSSARDEISEMKSLSARISGSSRYTERTGLNSARPFDSVRSNMSTGRLEVCFEK